jgi:hypothetical protein
MLGREKPRNKNMSLDHLGVKYYLSVLKYLLYIDEFKNKLGM